MNRWSGIVGSCVILASCAAPAVTPPAGNSSSSSTGFADSSAPAKAGPEILADHLNIPWDIAFLPPADQELLVTERGGQLLRIADDDRILRIHPDLLQ